ncbi:MAG: hypothetical protein U1E17_08565 [Geminicoccaceae bacterium]
MSPNSSTSSSEAARRFLAVFLGVVALGCTLVVGLNALIDPWWFFAQANPLNRVQEDVDERAQKTNWLEARKGEFDAVLIGSSRASYIDRHDFAPLKLFNYAVNAMTPREYQPYLDHFAAVNGRPKVIYLGVDLFTSRVKPVFDLAPPEFYLGRAGDPRYLASALLSLETAGYSLRSVQGSLGLDPARKPERYDRDDVRYFGRTITEEMRYRNLLRSLEQYRTKVYGADFVYDAGLPEVWRHLRESYPEARIVVFTTPTSEPLFSLMVQMGRFPDYERWLADLVGTFGEVWDFMGLNSITTEQHHYLDAHHFEPAVGRLIVARINGGMLPPEHADFGRLVTPANLPAHLATMRGLLPAVDPDPIRTARERLQNGDAAPPDQPRPAGLSPA